MGALAFASQPRTGGDRQGLPFGVVPNVSVVRAFVRDKILSDITRQRAHPDLVL